MKKPLKAKLLITGDDVININVGLPMGFHIPFWNLQAYYDGGIHRPLRQVGDPANNEHVGQEMFPITGMFCDPNKPPQDLGPDSWLSDGVWIGNTKYDPRDVLGAHIRVSHDQELVFTYIQSVNGGRPSAMSIRNFTVMTDFRPPLVAEHTVARFHGWREKIEANLPFMKHSWGEPDIPETVIYAGSGPSLRNNYHELRKRDTQKTSLWACNEAYKFLLDHGIPSDYFFCIDAQSPERWWAGLDNSHTCLVTTSFVNPAILKANWRRVYWFNIAGDSFYYNKVRALHPHLIEIDATNGVGSLIIESAWFKKAKRIIMIGCDFCYAPDPETKGIWRSVNTLITNDEWRALAANYPHYIVMDNKGQSIPAFMGHAMEACMVYGAAQCLWEKGVQVINATEGGCLRANPLARYLQAKIKERGSEPTTEIPLKSALTIPAS